MSWHDDGLCRDVETGVFYPDPIDGNEKVTAKQYEVPRSYCARCPVGADCLGESIQFMDWDGFQFLAPMDRKRFHWRGTVIVHKGRQVDRDGVVSDLSTGISTAMT